MIRSSKHILKFSNTNKISQLESLYSNFKADLEYYINLILTGELPLKFNLSSKLLPNNKLIHSRWKQVVYKQASEIVRSNIKFQSDRRFKRYKKVYSYFKVQGKQSKFTSKKFSELNLKPIIKLIKISLKNVSLNIDQRFLNFTEKSLHFNEFVGLKLPYFVENKHKSVQINLPIKWHKQSLKYKTWNRKSTVQLSKINNNFYITFFYEKEPVPIKSVGSSLGIDIGYKKLIADSNGKYYGTELEQVYNKISKKVRKSKNYNQLLVYKKNKINEITNQFLKENVGINYLVIENLKKVKNKSKFSKKFNNKLQYWSYKQVIKKLEISSEEQGYYLEKVSPSYTSQTCSSCGTVEKNNRVGEVYTCSCGLEMDADYNASINILRRGVYSPSNNQSNFIIFY